jgi:DNA replication and repair protein RecF
MRVVRIEARGWRNFTCLDLALPPAGAVFLGPNGHGKTNLLELLYYPVLFRSLRGARDSELVRFGDGGFHLRLTIDGGAGSPAEAAPLTSVQAGFLHDGRRKRVAIDGVETERVTDALGTWLAVAFQPADVALVAGGALERRRYLDQVLSVADPGYLRALREYRAALDQRNAALRLRQGDLAWAFDGALARAGGDLIRRRIAWVAEYGEAWSAACAALGETAPTELRYQGRIELGDPAAWTDALRSHRQRDLTRGMTSVGPQRDDLRLLLDGAPLRSVGSTGQHRTAAIALKLCERDTLFAARRTEPVLLLDDVFAELDRDRQIRLAERLGRPGERQVFVTAPRADELPPGLDLEALGIRAGQVATNPTSLIR